MPQSSNSIIFSPWSVKDCNLSQCALLQREHQNKRGIKYNGGRGGAVGGGREGRFEGQQGGKLLPHTISKSHSADNKTEAMIPIKKAIYILVSVWDTDSREREGGLEKCRHKTNASAS